MHLDDAALTQAPNGERAGLGLDHRTATNPHRRQPPRCQRLGDQDFASTVDQGNVDGELHPERMHMQTGAQPECSVQSVAAEQTPTSGAITVSQFQ